MIKKLTLDEFAGKFSYSDRRKYLHDLFVDEMEFIKSQCSQLRVLIFGSYITSKKNPRDIDVLLSLIACEESVYTVWTDGLRQKYPKEVDIHYYKTQQYIKDAAGLLKHFNKNPKNELQGISIKKAVEISDI
jgi:predicted nucleotidyltransferase